MYTGPSWLTYLYQLKMLFNIQMDDSLIINGKMELMTMEVVVAYWNVLSSHLSVRTRDDKPG